jgi:hypothetical protein
MTKAKQKILHALTLSLFVVLPRTAMTQSILPDEKCPGYEILCGIDPLGRRVESKLSPILKDPPRGPAIGTANLRQVKQTRQELEALDRSLTLRALRPVWDNNCSHDVRQSRRECRELAAKLSELAGCQRGTKEPICREVCNEMFDRNTTDTDDGADQCAQTDGAKSDR